MHWRPTATRNALFARARLYQQLRTFFARSDCLEVDTALLAPSTTTDPNIESICVPDSEADLYLQTSPEFFMKRLLASGIGSIYQICHAFRAGESGQNHQREFSLLEWYRQGYDYQQLMDDVETLIDWVSGQKNQYQRIRYESLFFERLGVDIQRLDLTALREICIRCLPGTNAAQLDFDQCLDLLIGLVIAPSMQGYVFVYDYPLSQAALAGVKPENPNLAERFELFYNGLELANGFSELRDAGIQSARFQDDNRKRRAQGLNTYPVDQLFLSALQSGLPKCAGVALGLDRLLMVLLKLDSIDQVVCFAES